MSAYEYFYEFGCFTREDLLKYAGNPKKADDILYSLKKKGRVVSVKRYLYDGIQYEDPIFYSKWQLYAPENLLKIVNDGNDAIV